MDVLKSRHFVCECLEENKAHAIWIEDDDRLLEAKKLLADFLANPQDPEFQKAQQLARSIRRTEKVAEVVHTIDQKRNKILQSGQSTWATKWMIGVSVALFLALQLAPRWFPAAPEMLFWLIAEPNSLLHGELWRLVTPIFWHGGILHLFFNALWMWDLGRSVERYLGTWRYLGLILLIAVPSNLAQLAWSGPLFGGLSGVVYGLLGYVWWRGRVEPHGSLQIHPQTMMFMMAWLVIGPLLMPNIANVVHFTGLLAGIAAGYLATYKSVRR